MPARQKSKKLAHATSLLGREPKPSPRKARTSHPRRDLATLRDEMAKCAALEGRTTDNLPGFLFRVEEAALVLNCRPQTLRNRISLRQIPVFRLGRTVRIAERDLRAFIEAGRVPAVPEQVA
jgi:excisionase family DNA binding protein